MRKNVRDVTRLLGYLSGTGVVVSLYMIIPLMIALSPVFEGNWSRMLAALRLLALGEIAVVAVLTKTSSRPEEQATRIERRRTVRVPASFDVEIAAPIAGGAGAKPLCTGHAIDASPDGMAVLVEPDWCAGHPGYVSLRAYVTETMATAAKARVVISEKVRTGDRAYQLLRLHLVAMDHEDKQSYLRSLAPRA